MKMIILSLAVCLFHLLGSGDLPDEFSTEQPCLQKHIWCVISDVQEFVPSKVDWKKKKLLKTGQTNINSKSTEEIQIEAAGAIFK